MKDFFKPRAKDVFGIVNGIDYDLWNPATDKQIAKQYGPKRSHEKGEQKSAAEKNGLPQNDVPVIGIISRLADQKGFDILAQDIENIMHMDLQIVLLGTGEPKYHELFKQMKNKISGASRA